MLVAEAWCLCALVYVATLREGITSETLQTFTAISALCVRAESVGGAWRCVLTLVHILKIHVYTSNNCCLAYQALKFTGFRCSRTSQPDWLLALHDHKASHKPLQNYIGCLLKNESSLRHNMVSPLHTWQIYSHHTNQPVISVPATRRYFVFPKLVHHTMAADHLQLQDPPSGTTSHNPFARLIHS